MPRWVKLLGLAALLAIAVVAILHLTGGGFHHGMPGDHGPPHHASAQHGSGQP